jgi:hypothetical protein
MKKVVFMLCLLTLVAGFVFSEDGTSEDISGDTSAVETRMYLTFYASTRGEMQLNFIPQWTFPALRGSHPITSDNSIALRLDASLSPIWAGLTADAIFTVAPFLNFKLGAMSGTGWNYDLFGKIPLFGLGMNRKKSIDVPAKSEVTGKGFNGTVWDLHAGAMLQFDLAAFLPGDWNHVVMQFYNKIDYFAYSKAKGDELWYYLGDDGMNQNAFRHSFELFAGYMMPIFVDLVGYQLEGTLPLYNIEAGGSVRDRGYSLTNAFIVNFKLGRQWSLMTIARITNGFKDPDTRGFEREWGFDRVQFIATWRIK